MHIRRSIAETESDIASENDHSSHMGNTLKPPVIRKGKLVVVDLAGSERIHKSGAYTKICFLYDFLFGPLKGSCLTQ